MWGKNELNKVSEPDSILYESLKLKIILTTLMQGSKLFSMKKASDYLISTKYATDEDWLISVFLYSRSESCDIRTGIDKRD